MAVVHDEARDQRCTPPSPAQSGGSAGVNLAVPLASLEQSDAKDDFEFYTGFEMLEPQGPLQELELALRWGQVQRRGQSRGLAQGLSHHCRSRWALQPFRNRWKAFITSFFDSLARCCCWPGSSL